MATEYAYQPLLPAMAAITGAFTGWPASRSLHFVLAFAYCCGPVTLFWLAFDWSESIALSLSAALRFHADFASGNAHPRVEGRVPDAHWGPLRLNNLVWYGEAPHNVALAMLAAGAACFSTGPSYAGAHGIWCWRARSPGQWR
jgi:hypothetical protein